MANASLTGKTAIITGAGGGIGRGIAQAFARDGAAVVVADKDVSGADETARLVSEAGGKALSVGVDICDEASLAAMVRAALAWTGPIDVLIANAGIMVDGDILKITLGEWRRALEVNATGAFLTVRAVLPHMLERGCGSIVFTASTVGLIGIAGGAAYSASKGAVVAMTRQLAADYADRGIRVNAIAPGAIHTALSQTQLHARAEDETARAEIEGKMIGRYPLARWGEVEEVAQAALYLASDRASWTTGVILTVDGGLLETR
jgi:NAD(P)-dependent dehydrogenase (short-subunit alcohol dehydrogenase family)